MVVDGTTLDAYYAACAPEVARPTIAAIVKVESGGNPWALNDNSSKRAWYPQTYKEAVALAKTLTRRGHSVDMGLAQINSRNLPKLRLTIEQVYEPCRNLMAASRILQGCYADAAARYGGGQRALVHALSCYNTGSLYGGRRYVYRILAAAGANDKVRGIAAASLGREPAGKANAASDRRPL